MGTRLPTFFILGNPKCGTTALYHYLRGHRSVFMCNPKEPHCFDLDLSGPHVPLPTYESLFSSVTVTHRAVGEATATYLHSQCAVPSILKCIPHAKFIVILRHPLQFIQSFHAQQIVNGNENIPGFEEAWRAEADRRRGLQIPAFCSSIEELFYSEWVRFGSQLERLFALARPEMVKVIMFDEFVSDTRKAYTEILQFLEIPDDGRTEFPRMNESRVPRSRVIQRALASGRYFATAICPPAAFKIHSMMYPLLKWNSRPAEKGPVSFQFARELLAGLYDDNLKLSRLLRRDLGHWLRCDSGEREHTVVI